MGAIRGLPQYLQIFYKALLDTFSEIEEKLAENGRRYRFVYAKEAVSVANHSNKVILNCDTYSQSPNYFLMINFGTNYI